MTNQESNLEIIYQSSRCGYMWLFYAWLSSFGLHLLIRQSRKVMSDEMVAFTHLANSFGRCCDDEKCRVIIIKSYSKQGNMQHTQV